MLSFTPPEEGFVTVDDVLTRVYATLFEALRSAILNALLVSH